MGMGTSIATARKNLFDLLSGHEPIVEADPPVQVLYGLPRDSEEGLRAIALLGLADPQTETDAALGPNARVEEAYGLQLAIKVAVPEAHPDERQTVDEAGFRLLDEIRDVVATKPTLNGAVRRARVSGAASDGVAPMATGGLVIFIDVTVACEVRSPRGKAPS